MSFYIKIIILTLTIITTGCGNNYVRVWPFSQNPADKLSERLNQRIDVSYQDSDLLDALADMHRKTLINFVVTPTVMASSPPAITLTAHQIEIGSIIQIISESCNLNVTIQNDVVTFGN